jgi:predicted DNA-binding protein
MKPDVQQDEGAARQAPPDSGSEVALRKALRILHRCYERSLVDMAESVCDAEEALDSGSDFVLSEIENKYLHRMRDLQMAICALRNRLQPGQSRSASVDELRCSEATLPAALSHWLEGHPEAELIQILLRPDDGDELRIIPVYYPGG